jgi:BolA family transcriptional regulator, general stress-responsive regulator
MTAERIARIRRRIEERLHPVSIDIEDDSARHAGHPGAREGGHFRLTLVATEFHGLSAIERHRLVFDAVAELMGTDIHALNIIARTPEELT